MPSLDFVTWLCIGYYKHLVSDSFLCIVVSLKKNLLIFGATDVADECNFTLNSTSSSAAHTVCTIVQCDVIIHVVYVWSVIKRMSRYLLVLNSGLDFPFRWRLPKLTKPP